MDRKDLRTARQIAMWIVNCSTESSTEGNWTMHHEEIEEHFEVELTEEAMEAIKKELETTFKEVVAQVWYDNELFDITLYTDYIIGYEGDEDDYE